MGGDTIQFKIPFMSLSWTPYTVVNNNISITDSKPHLHMGKTSVKPVFGVIAICWFSLSTICQVYVLPLPWFILIFPLDSCHSPLPGEHPCLQFLVSAFQIILYTIARVIIPKHWSYHFPCSKYWCHTPLQEKFQNMASRVPHIWQPFSVLLLTTWTPYCSQTHHCRV